MTDTNDAPSTLTASPPRRTTLRDLRKWAADGEPFPMLTCYDATSAKHLYAGGVRTLLVGDTAAQMILGYDSTLPAPLEFMLQITAAVRRGAASALIVGDMPFGSYQCGDDTAMQNATRFLTEGSADLVKLEVDHSFGPLIERMSRAGIPVMAHIGSRPQTVRAEGGFVSAGRTEREASVLADLVEDLVARGAAALLVEAVPDEVAQRIVERAVSPETGKRIPVIGCGAGPACHGHVVVLHDLLGLTDWQPPFAPPIADFGTQLTDAARDWAQRIRSGQYLKDGGPYRMR